MTISVEAIPALRDNYIWAISQHGRCILVDPGEAQPALDYLQQRGLTLDCILLTHHHHDHIGGVEELLRHHPSPCWGPDDERMPDGIKRVSEGQQVCRNDMTFDVLETPAHTRSHIAFHGNGMLFCGDTLFSAGCGRLFEGTPEQMQRSLDKLSALPDNTSVYCAHEYTQANCRFALAVEPENSAALTWAKQVEQLRGDGRITLPTRLGDERRYNPFLRTREPTVIAAAQRREPQTDTAPAAVFGVIRRWKDAF